MSGIVSGEVPAGPTLDIDHVAQVVGGVLMRRLGGDGRIEICDTISGNVNSIFKIRYQGRFLGVRIASNSYRFRYEKTIIKEVFAILLIYHNSLGGSDAVAGGIIDSILRAPVGGHVRHALVRSIVYYDWSLQSLPFPFFIYEWVDGEVLWNQPSPDQYFHAGRDLARVHRVRFEAFYPDIFAIHRTPLSWRANFEAAFGRELAAATPRLPPAVVRRLRAVDISDLRPGPPCLVHNDYSGANIIAEPGGARRIIDWDNWVVECPELDLVKMKYWSRVGPDRTLTPDKALFAAFVEGYVGGRGDGTKMDDELLRAYELLWLMRAYNFESEKRDDQEHRVGGTSWAAVYPGAEAYETYLREV
ncbi:MAG: phosphotransferase family protein [Alphaproteobacteria bacterium]